jgi:hypothetical protein
MKLIVSDAHAETVPHLAPFTLTKVSTTAGAPAGSWQDYPHEPAALTLRVWPDQAEAANAPLSWFGWQQAARRQTERWEAVAFGLLALGGLVSIFAAVRWAVAGQAVLDPELCGMIGPLRALAGW